MNSSPLPMTKGERVELGQLIRKREKVMKSMASERAAQMLAEFDRQSAQLYSYDQDEVWKQAAVLAEQAVNQANEDIRKRSRELGIPDEFAPSISSCWMDRGQNAVAGRRAELRRMAKSKIDAIEAEAVTKIERLSLVAQTEVISNGLQSRAAREFLDKMPSLESLMPQITATEVKKLADEKRNNRRRMYE